MPLTIDLPDDLERDLRDQIGDLDREAKIAALVELYRQRRVSHAQLSSALGLSRLETDGLLKRHNVTEDLPTSDEVRREVEETLRQLEP
jgi:hypothetical protein